MNIGKRFYNLPYERRAFLVLRFTLIFNSILMISKLILSYFLGVFLFISAIFNLLVIVSKILAYSGVGHGSDAFFKIRNFFIGFFLSLGGAQYIVYGIVKLMLRKENVNYGMELSILIACVSFIELFLAIRGIAIAKNKGSYLLSSKIIGLSQSLTAIALTEAALTATSDQSSLVMTNGMFYAIVGIIIVFLGLFIIFSPIIHPQELSCQYFLNTSSANADDYDLNVQMTSSKFLPNYYCKFEIKNNLAIGKVKKGEYPFKKWNILLKITCITLSEILILPYCIGLLIHWMLYRKYIKRLSVLMSEKSYAKLDISYI